MAVDIGFEESLAIFGLKNLENQSEETLKKIYHKLAKQKHPDSGGNTDEFIELRKAYAYLKKAINDPFFQKSENYYSYKS